MNAAPRSVLRIVASGPGNTVQDRGRSGYLRFGVTPAGPMDWLRFIEANRLAGNADDCAVIEIGLGGLTIALEGEARRIGFSAEGFSVERGGKALPPVSSIVLEPGQALSFRAGSSGSYAMLGVHGGLDLQPVLGSLSTHLRSGIGPLHGKGLESGMVLPLLPAFPDRSPDFQLLRSADDPAPLRFIPGPQDDYFTDQAFAVLTEAEFRLSAQSDRMGYRLEGPRLSHRKGADIVSDGIALGAMQVPGDGQLIILMADRQPTGGYPKVGTIIRADLPRLAQRRPGDVLRFQPVTVDDAVKAFKARCAAIEQRVAGRKPILSGPDLAALMSGNHASGMQSALDDENSSVPQEI